jgi:hypothetical protein
MALTVAQIHAAASLIDAAGQKPTLAGIRAKLGSGSYSTISAALQTWEREPVEGLDVPSFLPEDAQQAFDLAGLTMWQVAVKCAASDFDAERKSLNDRIKDLEENLRTSSQVIDQLDEDSDIHRALVEDLNEKIVYQQKDNKALISALLECKNENLVAQTMASERLKTIQAMQASVSKVVNPTTPKKVFKKESASLDL